MEDLIYKVMMSSALLTLISLALINMAGDWEGRWWEYVLTWTCVLSIVNLFVSVFAIIWV